MTDQLAQVAVARPAPVLRPYIARYAGAHVEGLPPGIHAGLPSRHAHLIISFGEPIELLRAPDGSEHGGRFRALVGGLHEGPALVRMSGCVHLVHVFLTPRGVRAILGATNPELMSRTIELSDVWGRRATQLVDQLSSLTSWGARFALLDDAFSRALQSDALPAPALWAWRKLARSSGRVPISALAREIGWSRSHLTHRFQTAFGLGPKTAGRIFRFERACLALKAEPRRIADAAHACGYYDQAHMTREWQALAGCSPRQWIAAELPFLQDYELQPGEDAAP